MGIDVSTASIVGMSECRPRWLRPRARCWPLNLPTKPQGLRLWPAWPSMKPQGLRLWPGQIDLKSRCGRRHVYTPYLPWHFSNTCPHTCVYTCSQTILIHTSLHIDTRDHAPMPVPRHPSPPCPHTCPDTHVQTHMSRHTCSDIHAYTHVHTYIARCWIPRPSTSLPRLRLDAGRHACLYTCLPTHYTAKRQRRGWHPHLPCVRVCGGINGPGI